MQNGETLTALMIAASSGFDEMIPLLEKEKMMVTSKKQTALMLAAINNKPECAKLLLDE